MIINPIIPLWLMGVLCVAFLLLRRKGKFNFIRQILIVILLFFVNLRIMVPGGEVTTLNPDVDVLFVCDNTISMMAEDYNGKSPRMEGVKKDCQYIMDKLPGASFSVITFGNDVSMKVPYTVDTAEVQRTIDGLRGMQSSYANGSSLNMVMSELEDYLDRDRDTYQVVFFISDGEITVENETLKSYDELAQYVDSGAVLGYGTKEGGYMKAVSLYGFENEPQYIYYYDDDFNRKIGVSKIDEENLRAIADDFKVDYVHMTQTSNLEDVIKDINKDISSSSKGAAMDSRSGYSETYYFFLIPLAVLLIYDMVYYKRKLK